jgi:hypothetical protein
MRLRSPALAPIALLLTAAVPASHGASIPVSNASFEDPAQSAMGTFASLTPPGWSIDDPGGITGADTDFGVWWPFGFFDYANGAPDGIQCGIVFLDLPPGSGVAGLRQALPATLAPDTRYTFEVYIGDPTDDSDPLLAGFPGFRVELLAGGNLVLADDDSTTQEGQFRLSRTTLPIGSAHPGLGRPLEIRLLNRNAVAGAEVDFDLVAVDATPGAIESYAFTAAHIGGSLAGWLVYDRERSTATQVIGRDASLTITEASGDLAPFAAIDFDAGFVNAAGTVLTLREPGGTGNFIILRFGASLSLDQPLPVASFQSENSSVYVAGVAVVEEGESGASFTVPEPRSSAAQAACGALAALALVRARRVRSGAGRQVIFCQVV